MNAVTPSVSAEKPPFLEIRNVKKSFGGVRALKDVSLTIEAGKIYHLMGENGCGKSTLIKILSGAQKADEGEILIDGQPTGTVAGDLGAIGALGAGIETVYQDLSLATNVDGIQISEHLPNMAKVADKYAIVRSLTSPEGSHERACHYMLTGYRVLPTLDYPAYGSVILRDASHPTGTVRVTLDSAGVPSYVIEPGAAWDHLEVDPRMLDAARTADVVCFGSLAQRSPGARQSIRSFLRATPAACLPRPTTTFMGGWVVRW